ncbi:hypothetical protein PLICRDRAFT_181075 [Plicaturopsis crispa FD-325 SS-3]|uniref:Uncharacterized protein n=1 Tax=Plicaturopsis crispa FD-325 SS-3 TaxID=944288 RepID=A0A0C9SV31_PLICR|nr:hypothetical protein PLICRDRAFT_181075 [Plicaturopsis crispa FD-325 SS-3]
MAPAQWQGMGRRRCKADFETGAGAFIVGSDETGALIVINITASMFVTVDAVGQRR